MNIRWFGSITALVILATALGSVPVHARTKDPLKGSGGKGGGDNVQLRNYNSLFDQQPNVVSNFSFITTNYGIFGLNVRDGVGSGFWPRGTENQYMFGAGAWFGALVRPRGSTELRKRVEVTYNPNSGQSWFVPGTIDDGPELASTSEGLLKYRTYFSTDFNTANGVPYEGGDAYANWPIWDASDEDTVRFNNYFGYYINDQTTRNRSTYTKGPAFISEEDIFSVYKDTDLNFYEGGAARRRSEGYPFGLQVEQMMYSWGFGDYADMVFLKYNFIHPESYKDTLFACWMAAVVDVDIALASNYQRGAANDQARYYSEEDTLNLAVQWTRPDQGEAGRSFGYLGFNFLESPATDSNDFIRKDKRKFAVQEQLGLRTYQRWPIQVDRLENEERYDFMSNGDPLNGATAGEAGDYRMLMGTGPFNMRPGDSARIVVGIVLGGTAKGGDADGTVEDMAELLRKVRFAQSVYNNNFRAPRAPEPAFIKGVPGADVVYDVPNRGWLPLNNAMVIQWDSTSELSVDTLEQGLDFLGYRIYRARRPELDTYDLDVIESRRRHPLAWRQIGGFGMPPAFIRNTPIPNTGVNIEQFAIATPVAANQNRVLVRRQINFAEPWLTYFNNLLKGRSPSYTGAAPGTAYIDPSRMDRYDSVTHMYLVAPFDTLPQVRDSTAGGIRFINQTDALACRDSLVKLIIARRVRLEPIMFSDTTQVDSANVTLVRNIRRPWEELDEVRRGVIAPYMRRITEGRIFFDDGDDNNDGNINYSANPLASEKLINNVEYYYNVRAYDEGDFTLPTPPKLNGKAVGLPNVVRTVPLGARPGNDVSINVIVPEDQKARLGGIYNVRLLVNDQQRFNQMFAGRTLELEFYRVWAKTDSNQRNTPDVESDFAGLYGVLFFLRDSATQQQIGAWSSLLPPELCPAGQVFTPTGGAAGYFTEKSYSWVDTDTLRIDTILTNPVRYDTTSFGLPNSTEKRIRYGSYTTTASCFGAARYALNLIGVTFDYAIEQWGGVVRAGDTFERSANAGPGVFVGKTNKSEPQTYTETRGNLPPSYYTGLTELEFRDGNGNKINIAPDNPASFNNGPGIWEIVFLPGGTETFRTDFILDNTLDPPGKDKDMVFEDVPYLNLQIRNVASFTRQEETPTGVTDVVVSYPFSLQPTTQPQPDTTGVSARANYPNRRHVPLDGFAMAAYGWRNTRGQTSSRFRPALAADSNSGFALSREPRYYLSRNVSTTGLDTLDFAHALVFGGNEFILDYTYIGGRSSRVPLRSAAFRPDTLPDGSRANGDFKAGDTIRIYTYGGAFGFPYDNTKVYARVGEYDPAVTGGEYTDAQMEQVQVVPNPYYLSHEGTRSGFEGRLYFTRLPRECTIKIYTTSGSLVRTIEHSETAGDEPDRHGLEVWDLLTRNKQRVASQTLVAIIETPYGASVTRKFSIVVGPARIIGTTD